MSEVDRAWSVLVEAGYMIVPSHYLAIEPSVAVEVLTPLVRDLREIAMTGNKYRYSQIAGAEEIARDMVNALVESSNSRK